MGAGSAFRSYLTPAGGLPLIPPVFGRTGWGILYLGDDLKTLPSRRTREGQGTRFLFTGKSGPAPTLFCVSFRLATEWVGHPTVYGFFIGVFIPQC